MTYDDAFGQCFGQVFDRPFPAKMTKRRRFRDRAVTIALNRMTMGAARLRQSLPGGQVRRYAAARKNAGRGHRRSAGEADDKDQKEKFHGEFSIKGLRD